MACAITGRARLALGCRCSPEAGHGVGHPQFRCNKPWINEILHPVVGEILNNHYFVSVSRFGHPPRWQWEIQRRPKPLGVKLCEAGFKSESAAKLAGEKALRKLVDGIAHDRITGAR
jgi:hypothetical protein